LHTTAPSLHCFTGLSTRKHFTPLDLLWLGQEKIREQCAVRSRDGASEIMILYQRQTHEHRGSEIDRGVDAFQIHVFYALHRVEHTGGRLRPAGNRRGADTAADAAWLCPDLSFKQEMLAAIELDHRRRLAPIRRGHEVLPHRG